MSINAVAPLAGAWIEITYSFEQVNSLIVAPLAGAWIEIMYDRLKCIEIDMSLPSRERGLKCS